MAEKVYRDFDQAELDAAYDARSTAPDPEATIGRWAAATRTARESHRFEADIAYGPTDMEKLDIFPADSGPAPVLLFFHGGYWRGLDKAAFGFLADSFVPLGVTLVVVNYALCPTVDMDEIVRQCRAATAWVHANAAKFNGDPERIFLSGHSAGGHLAAMTAITDWPDFAGLPADLVKGTCAISGLFELEPVRLSEVNADLHLTPESAHRNSPHFLLPENSAPLVLAVGNSETNEFCRQTVDFAAARQARGLPTELLELDGHEHFSVMDDFTSADGKLYAAQVALMRLTPPGGA